MITGTGVGARILEPAPRCGAGEPTRERADSIEEMGSGGGRPVADGTTSAEGSDAIHSHLGRTAALAPWYRERQRWEVRRARRVCNRLRTRLAVRVRTASLRRCRGRAPVRAPPPKAAVPRTTAHPRHPSDTQSGARRRRARVARGGWMPDARYPRTQPQNGRHYGPAGGGAAPFALRPRPPH